MRDYPREIDMITLTTVSKSFGTSPDVQFPLPSPVMMKLFTAFIKYAAALEQTKFLEKWKTLEITFHTDKNKTPWVAGNIPSEQDLWPVFHKLRPFQLQKESTYFPKVCNMLSHHFDSPSLRALFDYWKHLFLSKGFQGAFVLPAGDCQLNSEGFFNKFVNAVEYHHDPEKIHDIDKIAQTFPLDFQRGMIIPMLHHKLSAISTASKFMMLIQRGCAGTAITVSGP